MTKRILHKSWFLPKKGRRPNRAWIHLQPYDMGFYLLWAVDTGALKTEYKHAAKKCDIDDESFDMESVRGKFIAWNGYYCIAFPDLRPSPGTIAHEAFHLVSELGRVIDLEGEEAHAHLLLYVTDRIYELTRKKPCNV